ncbi:hypothetical protein HEP86_04640 [Streptomyces sp. RPA4-5]|uniref:hypothetical protein n=1 Tax=unclassified Streptomyces TaxID=2593676 RepID=UPI00143E9E11|nr:MULTISPECIES: hypothetical protein [unclassified Streptomyces]QIY53911.1 hypothetical protein HEP86_04640 [Streptomyces sp. RPA4-5]WJY36471.1 hypothetical protein QT196_03825 [Streptomyces sp. P9-2B-2]
MPLDVFAALGALVRAEAARNRTKPAKPPTDQPPAQRSHSPAPPPVEPPDTAAAPAPPAKKRHPLARLMQKLTTLIG